MFCFWSDSTGFFPAVVVDLEGSDVSFDTSGSSFVTVIFRLSGNDDMVTVLGVVNLEVF